MRSDDDEARGVAAQAPVADLRCDGVPATSDRLPRLRHALARWAEGTGLSGEQVDALTLAADEAMSNVVSHAYEQHPGTLDLRATHAPDSGVTVVVRDRGRWRPVADDPGPLHGRGLLLIRALAQDVVIERGDDGTTVSMTWAPRRTTAATSAGD